MKNPFSLFDFLGYIFPGAFTLLVIFYFVKMEPLDFVEPMYISDMMVTVKGWLNVSESIVSCSVFLILSYILGHLVAYISSITIEKFVIWWYGFPSEFLLTEEGRYWHVLHDGISMLRNKNYHYKSDIFRTYLLRFVVSMMLFPILIPTFFVKVLGWDDFFVKTLDAYLKDIILYKRKALSKHLNLPDSTHYDKVDYHRVIYHYVYEKADSHRQKMDIYVALYDFLRSLTLIFVGIFMYVMTYVFWNDCEIGPYYWWSLLGLLIVTYLFYMGFFKFYRRFTLEAFMCLVSISELK